MLLRGGYESHPDFKKLAAMQDKLWLGLVFSYGDMSSLNILACNNNIVGLSTGDSRAVSAVLGACCRVVGGFTGSLLERGE